MMALVVYEESLLTKIHQREQIFQFHGLVEKEIIIHQEGRGTGGILWPASELLCHFLNRETMNNSAFVNLNDYQYPQGEDVSVSQGTWTWENKLVLEFGSGLGLTSILLSSLGAKVLATDGEATVVEQLTRNFDLNLNEMIRSHCVGCVHRWGDDFQSLKDCLDQSARTWATATIPPLFDVILAADVVYGEDMQVWSLLEQSIQNGIACSHPSPLILIAQTERYPEREAIFFRKLMKRLRLRDTIDISGAASSAATSVNGEIVNSKCTLYVFTPH
jgi:hypothetical protein